MKLLQNHHVYRVDQQDGGVWLEEGEERQRDRERKGGGMHRIGSRDREPQWCF